MDADPAQARRLVSAGWAFLHAGNAAGAVRDFRSALALDPAYADALTGLCQGYLDLGQLDEADRTSETLLSLAPELAAAHRIRAELFRRKRMKGPALEHAGKAVELDPREPVGYHILALIHYDAKDYRKSLDIVAEGRKIAPWYGVLAAQEAKTLLELKGPKAAEPVAREALRLATGDDYVLRNAARVLLLSGKLEEARELLTSVLQRNANDETAVSLYLLTDRKRYGILRAHIQFPYWRRDHGVTGWVVWSSVWGLLIALAIAFIVGAHVPGIALGLGYRWFWGAQYNGHRNEVKKHFAKTALRTGF